MAKLQLVLRRPGLGVCRVWYLEERNGDSRDLFEMIKIGLAVSAVVVVDTPTNHRSNERSQFFLSAVFPGNGVSLPGVEAPQI